MQNKNRKYIRLTFIGLAGILILLLIFTNFRLNKLRNENIELKEKIDQLRYSILKDLIDDQYDFCFNKIEVRATTRNNVVAIGDTLEVSIGVFAMNYIWDDDTDRSIEPVILLAAGIDDDRKMAGPFDTIPVSGWEGNLEIKAREPGTYEIYGIYQFPEMFNVNHNIPFSMQYKVVDEQTFRALKDK